MNIFNRIKKPIYNYLNQIKKFNKNIRLLLFSSMLSFVAMGIFNVNFNLYILSLGIEPDGLGNILSAAPFATMFASIPIGFLAEKLGFRKVFIFIYSVSGLALLLQVATPNIVIITGAALLSGIASSGNFVVKLPFLSANIADSERTTVFSVNSVVDGITFAIGAILGGYLPNLFQSLGLDLSIAYRYTLFFSGAMNLIAVIPVFLIADSSHLTNRKISLAPYLWGFDRFMVKSAVIEFLLGLMHGLIVPFINIFFLFYLNTSREYYSWVEAFIFVPVVIATLIGPILAQRIGNVRVTLASRFIVPLCLVIFTLGASPWIGTGSYWGYRGLFSMGQSLWFAFAMTTASRKSKAALSSWLQISFQIGIVLSAQITGNLLANENYAMPFYISAGAALLAGILTWVFIRPYDKRPDKNPLPKPVIGDMVDV